MGARDTEEMLEACKAQGIQDERQITHLQRKLDAIRTLCDDPDSTLERDGERGVYVEALLEILDRTPEETP